MHLRRCSATLSANRETKYLRKYTFYDPLKRPSAYMKLSVLILQKNIYFLFTLQLVSMIFIFFFVRSSFRPSFFLFLNENNDTQLFEKDKWLRWLCCNEQWKFLLKFLNFKMSNITGNINLIWSKNKNGINYWSINFIIFSL